MSENEIVWPKLFGDKKHLFFVGDTLLERTLPLWEERDCRCLLCLKRALIKLKSILEDKIMPLVKGKKAKSKKGFSSNVKKEMESGKSKSQSVAIAYSEARGKKKSKKK